MIRVTKVKEHIVGVLGPHNWNLYTFNEMMRPFVIEVVDRCVLKSVQCGQT